MLRPPPRSTLFPYTTLFRACLRDIGYVDGISALVQDIPEIDAHSAFGYESKARYFPGIFKIVAVTVQIDLINTVIVRYNQIRIPVACQIHSRCCERPSSGLPDAGLFRYICKGSVSIIPKQIIQAAVCRILITVGHHPGMFKIEQIQIFMVVSPDKKIQMAVTVIIQPDSIVRIDMARQARLFGHLCKSSPLLIPEQGRPSPPVYKQIFKAGIVIVSPDAAHGGTRLKIVQIRHAELLRHIFESTISHILIE